MPRDLFNAEICENAVMLKGSFPINFEKRLKEIILNKFQQDKRINHSVITNPTVTRLHISKRAFDKDSILVGVVCIGEGHYLDYKVLNFKININIGIDNA